MQRQKNIGRAELEILRFIQDRDGITVRQVADHFGETKGHVRTTLLTGPSTNDRFLRDARRLRSAAFVELHTDVGITGIGETYAGYFCPEAVPAIVDFFAPILIGADASIGELWRRMYHCGNFWCRVGLGASVINGIEAALWDLHGKLAGRPVYELLGGRKHERLPAYATGGPSNYPLNRLAEKADRLHRRHQDGLCRPQQ